MFQWGSEDGRWKFCHWLQVRDREKDSLESPKTFGISTEEGERIIHMLGSKLLSEHEKLFDNYCRQVFGSPLSRYMHLQGKGPSVRASRSP
jgi:hypothetical protein